MAKLAPVHPGEILLQDFVKPNGLSLNALAIELHVRRPASAKSSTGAAA